MGSNCSGTGTATTTRTNHDSSPRWSPPPPPPPPPTNESSSVSLLPAQIPTPKPSVRVRLYLLDASRQTRDDPESKHLLRRLRTDRCWNDACSSQTVLNNRAVAAANTEPKTSGDDTHTTAAAAATSAISTTPSDVQRQVTRFLRTSDKYLAYASMLFKSRAFHEAYNDELLPTLLPTSSSRRCRPIVDLPRTGHRKPYIPLPDHWRSYVAHAHGDGNRNGNGNGKENGNENDYDYNYDYDYDYDCDNAGGSRPEGEGGRARVRVREEDVFSFSISHQFPFVGMAEIATPTTTTAAAAAATATATATYTTQTQLWRPNNDKDSGSDGSRGGVECNHSSTTTTTETATATATTTTATATATANGATLLTDLLRDRLPPLVVGLDIVVFEKLNTRLYSSYDEFLEVFRDQFTANEWENRICIQSAGAGAGTSHATATATAIATPPNVTEFYLRWAMKEAYTKAVGVGMGLRFGSFEIVLEGIDRDDKDATETSLWGFLRNRTSTHGVVASESESERASADRRFVRGTVHFADQQRSDEHFVFCFLPLQSSSSSSAQAITEGCACVCAGPFAKEHSVDDDDDDDDDEGWKTQIDVTWTDFETLTLFHQNDDSQ
eukprot:jgi/Psemu1/65347/estExt_Genemark1.C_1210055